MYGKDFDSFRNDYIVYFHIKPLSRVVFYVGMGVPERAYDYTGRNYWWHNTEKKHGREVKIVRENLTWDEACALEIALIAKIGRRDLGLGTLVNLTNGGEDNPMHNPEIVKRVSATKSDGRFKGENNPAYGKVYPNAILAAAEANYVTIYQYDLDGFFIKEWRSLTEAAKFYGIPVTGIHSVANGNSISAANYLWSYYLVDKLEPLKTSRFIYQYDSEYKLIKRHFNVREAVKTTGFWGSNISQCLNNKVYRYKDCFWRYFLGTPEEVKNSLPPKRKLNAKHFKVKVEKLDLGNNFIEIFESIKLASQSVNVCSSSIRKSLDKLDKTVAGFKWRRHLSQTS